MLESVKITKRQSEIREQLAELVGKPEPTEDETRSMEKLDTEYKGNEVRFRAALTSEDEERKEAAGELETRSETEWSDLAGQFELRQAALALDEGRALDGATAEIASELRSQSGFQGIPVPWEALETRAGETVASGTPNPIRTMPPIERLFAMSSAMKMGAAMVNVGFGEMEYPVTTSGATPGWAGGELGEVPGPQTWAVTDKPLKPDHTLGVTMKITRKALKQSGMGLEQSVRRDISAAVQESVDAAVFQGTGSGGQPQGVISGAASYGITETAVDAAASYAAFREAITRFMVANAAMGPKDVNLLLRPEVFDSLDADLLPGTAVSEWDRLMLKVGMAVLTTTGVAAPVNDPPESKALLTTKTGGVAPIFCGMWGAVDLIRDQFSEAKSGQLVLTALTTLDVTVSRPAQLQVITGLQS